MRLAIVGIVECGRMVTLIMTGDQGFYQLSYSEEKGHPTKMRLFSVTKRALIFESKKTTPKNKPGNYIEETVVYSDSGVFTVRMGEVDYGKNIIIEKIGDL